MAPVYQKNVKYTLASHAVECLRPSDDAVNELLKKYGVSHGKRHG